MGELVGARQMGVNAAFARDMKSHFPGVQMDDLIALKAMGIDCDFVTDMQKAGVKMRSADEAIALRAMPRRPAAPRGSKGPKGEKSATVSFGPGGNVIEARSADGRIARIEVAAPPEPPEPPED